MLLITIITPTYNRKELLGKAILSVINQRMDIPFQWELIIVDDGSKDGTYEYIEKYLIQYPNNIQYIYQENAGVGKARNTGLSVMSKKSNYIIFLDSDDELKTDLFYVCLKKWEELKKQWIYDTILWFYFLCEDEKWRVIGDRRILEWQEEVAFGYMSFLRWDINVEMWLITKSNIFLSDPKLRFPEDIITEWVMWSIMWQFMHKNNLKILLWDYIGRLYNINHTWEIKITKTISPDRFRKNAIGNERILAIIGKDLLEFWYIDNYAELHFRTWINWVLCGEKEKWLNSLRETLKYKKSLRNIGIYILSTFSKKIILFIYKKYNES